MSERAFSLAGDAVQCILPRLEPLTVPKQPEPVAASAGAAEDVGRHGSLCHGQGGLHLPHGQGSCQGAAGHLRAQADCVPLHALQPEQGETMSFQET